MIELRYDKQKLKRLERELRGFGKTALPRVMSRALNRTAGQARTASSRLLSQQSGVKVGDVKKRIILKRASYSSWHSAIRVSSKRLSLRYLKPRQTRRGLSVKSGRKRVTIRHAFPALKGWFIRLPAAGGYKQTIGVTQAKEIDQTRKVGRLPIGRIRGPILSRIFAAADEQVRDIQADSAHKLQENIDDQVQLILRRRLPA